MTALIKKLNQPSLRDRLAKLPAGAGGPLAQRVAERLHARRGAEQCLLLDVSGSMQEDCGDGRRKIDALRSIVREFPQTRQFCFASVCVECAPGEPGGSTDMAGAFRAIKARGIRHAVLVTDGIPDSEPAALREAGGLTIDVIYVGPQPEPPFLAALARACGGQYGAGNLAQPKQLAQKISTLLLEDQR